MDYIYIIHNNFDTKTKIGSTKYPCDRINSYKTYSSEPWTVILILKILNDDCYKLDEKIKKEEVYIRSKVLNSGTEWYNKIKDKGGKLKDYLNKINIEFEDVTNTIDLTKRINYKNLLKEDEEKENNKIFRFGQKEVFDNFTEKLNLPKYWGAVIAPTGWGKSFIHLILIGLYLSKYKKNVMLLTKRKDVLIDQIDDTKRIKYLQDLNLFPKKIKIVNQVNNFSIDKINKESEEPKLIIINVDKLIHRKYKNTDSESEEKINKKYEKIDWNKIGFLIFDELHWVGATCISELIEHAKKYVDYGIGSSATPVRENEDNQKAIYNIFGKNKELNILYEVSYEEAWENNIIVPVEHNYFPVNNFTKGKNKKCIYEFTNEGKIEIINNILKFKLHYNKLIFYFQSRHSLLKWYKFINTNYFKEYKLFMSFHLDKNIKINYPELSDKEIENGIVNFKKEDSYSILFVVNKATEGFDDKKVELVANLDYTKSQGIVQLIQKLGRSQRILEYKKKGYYVAPIPMDTELDNMDYLYSILDNYLEAIKSKKTREFGNNKGSTQFDALTKYINFNNFKTITIEEIIKKIKQKRESRVNLRKEWKNICIKLKEVYGFNDRTHFYNEYKKIYKKDVELLDIDNPYLKIIIETKSWYEWLNIDTRFYNNIEDAIIYTNSLNFKNIDINNWLGLCKLNHKLPPYPEIWWRKDFSGYNLFNKKKKIIFY